jgi:hypothetical protein|tara:strand:- start:1026 stop:1145 length:120 start_codon:yes stop_codon:yes gene_type:complete
MILKGEISEKGLQSPIHHMPFEIFKKNILEKHGIFVKKD